MHVDIPDFRCFIRRLYLNARAHCNVHAASGNAIHNTPGQVERHIFANLVVLVSKVQGAPVDIHAFNRGNAAGRTKTVSSFQRHLCPFLNRQISLDNTVGSSLGQNQRTFVHRGSSGVGKLLLDRQRSRTVLHQGPRPGHGRIKNDGIRSIEDQHPVVDDGSGSQRTAGSSIAHGKRSHGNPRDSGV